MVLRSGGLRGGGDESGGLRASEPGLGSLQSGVACAWLSVRPKTPLLSRCGGSVRSRRCGWCVAEKDGCFIVFRGQVDQLTSARSVD